MGQYFKKGVGGAENLVCLLLLLCLLFAAACSKTKEDLSTREPTHETHAKELTLPQSNFAFNLSYPLANFELWLNEKIVGNFLKKGFVLSNNHLDSVYLEIDKRARIKLSKKNNQLTMFIPITLRGEVYKKTLGLTMGIKEPITVKVNVHLTSKLSIDEHWILHTKTTLKQIDWLNEPEIRMAFIRVPLRGPLQTLVDDHKEDLLRQFDELLSTHLDLKTEIAKLWDDIQQPLLINKKGPKLWINFETQELKAFLNLKQESTLFASVLNVSGYMHMDGHAKKVTPSPLPRLTLASVLSDTFSIRLRTSIPWDTLNILANKVLAGKELKKMSYTLRIQHVELYSSGERIALKIKLKGELEADVYALGNLGYDADNRLLYVSDFDFELSSKDLLLTIADKLAHDELLMLIEEKLVVSVGEYLDTLPEVIRQGIEKGKTGSALQVNMKPVQVKSAAWLSSSAGIQAVFETKGKAHLFIKKPKLKSKLKIK